MILWKGMGGGGLPLHLSSKKVPLRQDTHQTMPKSKIELKHQLPEFIFARKKNSLCLILLFFVASRNVHVKAEHSYGMALLLFFIEEIFLWITTTITLRFGPKENNFSPCWVLYVQQSVYNCAIYFFFLFIAIDVISLFFFSPLFSSFNANV